MIEERKQTQQTRPRAGSEALERYLKAPARTNCWKPRELLLKGSTWSVLGCLLAVGCSNGPGQTALTDRAEHESRFVEANGIRIHVLDWGGTGDNLLLIGGSDGSPHHFDDLAARLSDQFRVMAPARRGHGQSDAPSELFDVDGLAENLLRLLDELGVERTSVLAHSFGGAEITRFAALHRWPVPHDLMSMYDLRTQDQCAIYCLRSYP